MTSDDPHVAAATSLDRLLRLTPDPDRAERVRVRCRTRLARSRRRTGRMAAITGRPSSLLTPAVVAGCCVLYVVALAITTLRLEGILR